MISDRAGVHAQLLDPFHKRRNAIETIQQAVMRVQMQMDKGPTGHDFLLPSRTFPVSSRERGLFSVSKAQDSCKDAEDSYKCPQGSCPSHGFAAFMRSGHWRVIPFGSDRGNVIRRGGVVPPGREDQIVPMLAVVPMRGDEGDSNPRPVNHFPVGGADVKCGNFIGPLADRELCPRC